MLQLFQSRISMIPWFKSASHDNSTPYSDLFGRIFDEVIKVTSFREKGMILSQKTLSDITSTLLDVIEAVVLTIVQLKHVSSVEHLIHILLSFYKMITHKSVIKTAIDIGAWIARNVMTILEDFKSSIPQVQSLEEDLSWISNIAKGILTNYDSIRRSPMISKFQNLLKFFLTFGIFQSYGLTFHNLNYKDFEIRSIKKKYSSLEDFFHAMFTDIVWFLERAGQAVKFGSWTPFLHTSTTYTQFLEDAQCVLEDAHKMNCPEAFELDEHDFQRRLDSCSDRAKEMLKVIDSREEKKVVANIEHELHMLKINFQSKDYAQRDRRAPFSVLVVGDSKIAKSQFTNILFQQFGKVNGKDIDPSNMWTRNSLDKFYSGYRSSKWCIRLDDIAQFNPSLGTLDPTIADIIMLINDVTFVAPMADLEDKGVVAVRPDLVIGTTNVEELNAQAYFACPLAVRRRFPYVVNLEVKKEYRATRFVGNTPILTTMVDTNLIPPIGEDELMNIWNITLSKVIAEPGQNGMASPALEKMASFDDIYDFLVVYSELSKEHGRNQSLSEQATASMARVQICNSCYRPVSRCSCVKIQSHEQSNEILTPFDIALTRLRLGFPRPGSWSIPLRSPLDILEEESPEIENFDQDFFDVYWRSLYVETILEDFDEVDQQRLMQATHDVLFTDIDAETIAAKCKDWVSYACDEVIAFAKLIAKGASKIVNSVKDVMTCAKSMGIKVASSFAKLIVRSIWKYQLHKFQAKFAKCGEAIRRWCEHPVGYLAIVFASSVLVTTAAFEIVKSLMGRFSSKSSSPCVQGGSIGTLARDEKKNPWIKDELILSDYYIPSKSSGWKNLSRDFVLGQVKQNTVSIRSEYQIEGEWKHMPATAVCVAGHIYMTNNHSIPSHVDELTMHISDMPDSGNVNSNVKFLLQQNTILRIPEKDLAFFRCRVVPPRSDLTGLFLKNTCTQMVCNGDYIHCRWREFPIVNSVRAIHFATPEPGDVRMPGWFGRVTTPTIVGDCGSPLIGFSQSGPLILGLHRTLLGYEVGAPIVLASDVQIAIDAFGTQVQCGEPSFASEHMGPLNHKSTILWTNEGQARVYGSTTKGSFRCAPKSNVVDTYISEAAQEEGFKKVCVPPMMKGPEVWQKNIEPTLTQEFAVDATLLDQCVNEFADEVLAELKPEFLEEIFILDDVTTMNGASGVRFLDKINRNTSMGYPYRKSKRNFLVPIEPTEFCPDPVEYTPDVMEEVAKIIAAYERGERYMPVFVMSLKDEPVPQKKRDIKKTRGFMGGSAAWQFVCRKYLLAFVRVFQLNPYIFEGAPGMNCNSSSWSELYEYLIAFGPDKMIAGDFEKFDKRMSPEFMLAAFDFIVRILRAAHWSEKDILIILCIGMDVSFPCVWMQGDIIELFGSNPSGWALTVILNCIVNSLYMRYSFAKLGPNGSPKGFKKNVHLITYGDDNAMGVSDNAPWFNHTSIAKVLASIKVVYTMADKTSESVPYVNIADISFLKRRFVPCEEGRVACPLDWASIEKMLTTCVRSRAVCPEKQAIDSMRSAIGEFFQYGREVFEENVAKMHRIVEKCDLYPFVEDSTFPTFDELLEAHYNASGMKMGFSESDPSLVA